MVMCVRYGKISWWFKEVCVWCGYVGLVMCAYHTKYIIKVCIIRYTCNHGSLSVALLTVIAENEKVVHHC